MRNVMLEDSVIFEFQTSSPTRIIRKETILTDYFTEEQWANKSVAERIDLIDQLNEQWIFKQIMYGWSQEFYDGDGDNEKV